MQAMIIPVASTTARGSLGLPARYHRSDHEEWAHEFVLASCMGPSNGRLSDVSCSQTAGLTDLLCGGVL